MKNKKKIVYGILGIVLVIAAIIIAMLVLRQEENTVVVHEKESPYKVERDESVNANEVIDKFNENIDKINGEE